MTRPIKFRAWDKEGKRMGEVFGIDFHPFEVRCGFGDLGVEHEFIDERDGVVLMQFTGLLDKNGKEIWEGDIISFKDGYVEGENGEYGDKTHTVSIAYDHHRFVAKRKDGTTWDNDQSDEDFRDDTFWEDCEVLGNIYENPELLEAK